MKNILCRIYAELCAEKTILTLHWVVTHGPWNYYKQTAGYPLKLRFQIPHVFLVRPQISAVPIYIIRDYYIHKTDLADLSSFKRNFEFFAASIEISFTFRINEFTTWANQIPCVFPVFFGHFPVQWVPWDSCKLNTAEDFQYVST